MKLGDFLMKIIYWSGLTQAEVVEGYLPNMPTHFMLIPKALDGFAWPYNKEQEMQIIFVMSQTKKN